MPLFLKTLPGKGNSLFTFWNVCCSNACVGVWRIDVPKMSEKDKEDYYFVHDIKVKNFKLL